MPYSSQESQRIDEVKYEKPTDRDISNEISVSGKH